MARSSLEHISDADPGLAAGSFDGPTTLVQSDSPLTEDPSPAGWEATSAGKWTSYRQFAADLANGLVPSYVGTVHYDNESWSATPLGEQLHPGAYERRFCGLAHANGWRCYTGPGQDLCGVLPHPEGEAYAQCYISLDLAGKAARHADVIDIQAQALEPRGARVYGRFVKRAAAQARAANPHVLVLGNLTPSPDGHPVSVERMYRCAEASLPYVSGFYTTVTADEGPQMVELLKRLED